MVHVDAPHKSRTLGLILISSPAIRGAHGAMHFALGTMNVLGHNTLNSDEQERTANV